MSQAAAGSGRHSPAEYLALERSSELRHEYADGEIFAMAGGTLEHNLIAANIAGELRAALKDRRCFGCPSDMRVKISASTRYTYPDVSVVCGEPAFEDPRRDTLLNPSVLFEVLSDSSESYDRGGKFAQYRTLPSLTDYVLVDQKQVLIEHFRRQLDGTWLLRVVAAGRRLELPSIGCEVEVDEIYLRVFDQDARPVQ